jgi:hypothetical protein
MTEKRGDIYGHIRRQRDLREADEVASLYCTNCKSFLPDEESVWIHQSSCGDPDDPEVSEEYYCDECVQVDANRRVGGGPPEEQA